MFSRASHHGQAFTNFKYLGHDAGARAELESEILRNGEKWWLYLPRNMFGVFSSNNGNIIGDILWYFREYNRLNNGS